YRLSRIAALLTCALVAACGVDQAADQPFGTGSYEANLLAQLDASRHTLADKGIQLTLVGFTPADPLDSDDSVGAAKAHMLEDAALVPQFDGVDASTFKLATVAQRMSAFRAGTDDIDVVSNIQSMAFPGIKVGQRAL